MEVMMMHVRRTMSSNPYDGQERGEIDPSLDPSLNASTLIRAADGIPLQYLIDPRVFPAPSKIADELRRSVHKMLDP